MKNKSFLFLLLCGIIFLFSCKQKKQAALNEGDILHNNEDMLTEVIIYDVFTPPVASRVYVYSSLASYEAIRFSEPGSPSIADKLHGFDKIPEPEKDKQYNYTLAATRAFFTTVKNVKVFSVDSLKKYEDGVYEFYHNKLDQETFDRSVKFGDTVARVVLKRANDDGYIKSRGKEKFLGSEEPGKWRPTAPDYLDGIEWCWNTMKPMVLDSSSQFTPARPPQFSKDTNSVFYKSLLEVYTINKHLTDEQKEIARYWDDNPFVIEHSGHLMFGNKKITPGGHWMGITAIAAKMTKADPVKIARSYALTAIALYDAFIACWDEKYRSNVIRPITVINEWIEPGWASFLQTPPFPEYTSGHSSITASASTVLAKLYGNNFAFQDTSDLRYIGMQRHFNSFQEAAAEASISRVYGGVHYRSGVEAGAVQGRQVGEFIVSKLLQ